MKEEKYPLLQEDEAFYKVALIGLAYTLIGLIY